MDFPDLDAIHASLAFDIKTTAHAVTTQGLEPFGRRFFHFVSESRSHGAA